MGKKRRRRQDRGPKMPFFFHEKDYPDMRPMMEELKKLTGKKRAITILHMAARRMLREERTRAAAIERVLTDLQPDEGDK